MEIKVDEKEYCKVTVHYEADAEEVLNKKNLVLENFKKAPIPGFRPGKSTYQAVMHHYKDQIDDATKKALIEDAYHNTLFEKKYKPLGAPKINNVYYVDGRFECDFEMMRKPEFDILPLKDLEIVEPHQNKDEKDLSEEILQELRVKHGEAVPFEPTDVVGDGDNVIINYTGSIDGQIVPELSAEGEMFTVGKSKLKAFDEQLVGMKAGDKKTFVVHLDNTALPSMANKDISFDVEVIIGSKNIPAALDDALGEKFGRASLADLKDLVFSTASAQIANAHRKNINDAISNKLVEMHNFEVPIWHAESEAKYLASSSKVNYDALKEEDKKAFLDMAMKNVKLSLILDRVRDVEPESQLTDQETFDIVKRNLAKQPDADAKIREMNSTGYLQILFSRIKDEYTLDYIYKQVKLVK